MGTETKGPLVPFSNGSEYLDWQSLNCWECAKGNFDTPWNEVANPCPLQRAVDESSFTDDQLISWDLWKAIGGDDEGLGFDRQCTQFEAEGAMQKRIEEERRVEYNKHQIDLLTDLRGQK